MREYEVKTSRVVKTFGVFFVLGEWLFLCCQEELLTGTEIRGRLRIVKYVHTSSLSTKGRGLCISKKPLCFGLKPRLRVFFHPCRKRQGNYFNFPTVPACCGQVRWG